MIPINDGAEHNGADPLKLAGTTAMIWDDANNEEDVHDEDDGAKDDGAGSAGSIWKMDDLGD